MAALKAAFTGPWLQDADLADTDTDADADADASLEECRAMINLHQIDMGEASALVLAQQLATQGTAALLLIDEHRGRQAAQYCQVAIIGTAGLLVLAKPANRRCRNGKPEPNGLAAWRSSCWPLWKSTVSKYWLERHAAVSDSSMWDVFSALIAVIDGPIHRTEGTARLGHTAAPEHFVVSGLGQQIVASRSASCQKLAWASAFLAVFARSNCLAGAASAAIARGHHGGRHCHEWDACRYQASDRDMQVLLGQANRAAGETQDQTVELRATELCQFGVVFDRKNDG